ncbi:MAG TPA: tyrosine-protein phosphatase [Candidatus Dormibacteraeota bacterium]|nr:tyrosine-protein phosphatase [Candidatus Dormibacteraeota bacterium]
MTFTRPIVSEIATRRLPVPGTYNLRDVGGLPTSDGGTIRWRTLLRSDALHRLDDAGREQLSGIGLRTVIDLREDDEVAVAPDRLGDLGVRLVRRPLYESRTSGIPQPSLSSRTLADIYAMLARDRGDALVEVLRLLAQPGVLPAVVHCSAGKDRTGIVIALVLATVGVSDDIIAADFAATAELMEGAFRAELIARNLERGLSEERATALLSAEPELILGFLDAVRASHGSVAGFLAHHGMTEAERAMLRASLVEGIEPP